MPTPSTSTTTSARRFSPRAVAAVLTILLAIGATPIRGQVIQWSAGILSLADGTSAAPSLFFGSSTQNGIYKQGTNALGIANSGALQFLVTGGTIAAVNNSCQIQLKGTPDPWVVCAVPALTTGFGSGAALTSGSKTVVGEFTIGTTPASPTTLTLPVTATVGWACVYINETTAANTIRQTSYTQTTSVATWAAGPTANDKVIYMCQAF